MFQKYLLAKIIYNFFSGERWPKSTNISAQELKENFGIINRLSTFCKGFLVRGNIVEIGISFFYFVEYY